MNTRLLLVCLAIGLVYSCKKNDSTLMKNLLQKELLSANGKGPDGGGPPGQNGGGGNGGGNGGGGGKGGGGGGGKGGCSASPGVTDADGNVYDTVVIGNQTWTVQNYRCSKFSDGTLISRVSVEGGGSNSPMFNATSAAYGFYLDDSITYDALYGKVYNSYAIDDSRLPPAGWHVATTSDWITLINYMLCDGCTAGYTLPPGTYTEDSSAIKLRAAKRVWSGCTSLDSYCFNILPGGEILSQNSRYVDQGTIFWAAPSTDVKSIAVFCGRFVFVDPNQDIFGGPQFHPAAYVRLVKDNVALGISNMGKKLRF